MAGRIDSADLGLEPNSGERDLFRWFLASFLFGKRIQQKVARRTFEVFRDRGVDNPKAILQTGWRGLVKLLGEGHYVRYDESTARYLLETSQLLIDRYGGRITAVFERSKDKQDLQRRLDEFKGVGPKTVEIFLRDVDERRLIGGKAKKMPAA
ncbi:MAG: DNA methylase [Actinobacteria bacterium]|nr:MAG: DNA methylase [Actinomycetota bacterium]